jgi:gluconate:H+ symporter, GntP family
MSLAAVLIAADAPKAGNAQLLIAAALGIAAVVLLIVWGKVHPFLALIGGAAVLGLVANLGPSETVDSFSAGVGATVGSVGLLIAIGAMIGGMMAESGGADAVVERVINSVSDRWLPWAMAGVAAVIGLPLFFEVGVVLLIPVVLLVSTRSRIPLMQLGIPALAGLSVLHGLVPPHPGPLVAIAALKADLGLTLLYGLLIAIPTVIIAGPLFGSYIGRRIHAEAPAALLPTHVHAGATTDSTSGVAVDPDGDPYADTPGDGNLGPVAERGVQPVSGTSGTAREGRRRPAFVPAVITILLPVTLMLLRAIADLTLDENNRIRQVMDVLGNPVVALLCGLVLAMFTMGFNAGLNRVEVSSIVGGALPAIAAILLIVAAGGGFKQVLVDSGVAGVIGDWAKGANFSPLILGWLVAVGIRLATGSATVATITAAGIVAPLAAGMPTADVSLLVLAIGSGSLFFSHVNDAGFWLVNQYFGLTVGETIRSWSVMETIISVCGLIGVLILNAVV